MEATTRRYVLGFFMTPDGTVLIKKTKPDWQRGKWNGIGGSIEEGETPLRAMIREFGEEANLSTLGGQWTELFKLSGNTVGNANKQWEMTVFVGHSDGIRVRQFFPRIMAEGEVEVLKEMPEPMDSTAAWLLPMCWDLARHGIKLTKGANECRTSA